MNDIHDLQVILDSQIPLVVVETHEEARIAEMVVRLSTRIARSVFRWTITDGLRRLEFDDIPIQDSSEPAALLRTIRAATRPGIYLLLDFHPYLEEPLNVRLLKEIALDHAALHHTVMLVSHSLELPAELKPYCARFELSLPDAQALERIVRDEAVRWSHQHAGQRVKTDPVTLKLLVRSLGGLAEGDARRLAHKAIFDDGAITREDLPEVTRAKHALLDMEGVLYFEYDTAQFADVGGLASLKRWLETRRVAFDGKHPELDPPRGILLLGVQGGGKSLAARAVAGTWSLPLLRLDFAALYNKFFGETERNLRAALKAAEAMAPCVLWIDEVEKGVATGDHDAGTSRRILGTLLTWMAERDASVFLVATANDIEVLPPELIRKGRLDEIFFVDLPDEPTRATIFAIHLRKRSVDPAAIDLAALARATSGFSGAEIEQAVVAALYTAASQTVAVTTHHVLAEVSATRPLSVVMAEHVAALRAWARDRTVPAN